jgi:hypothetical protein
MPVNPSILAGKPKSRRLLRFHHQPCGFDGSALRPAVMKKS